MGELAGGKHPSRNKNSEDFESIEERKKAVRDHFDFLKKIDDPALLRAHSIEFPNGEGRLVPVCAFNATDENLIRDLATWREEHKLVYPTQFTVTLSGTATWIQKGILEEDGRIMFLVESSDGNIVGHMGFIRGMKDNMDMEFDNMVRGRRDISPGIMATAINAIMNWAEEKFGARGIGSLVFEDNERVIRFLKRVGKVEVCRIPLRRHQGKDSVSYLPLEPDDNAPPDKSFIWMLRTGEAKANGPNKDGQARAGTAEL